VECLVNWEITETRDALSALKLGVEIERAAANLPAYVVEVMTKTEEELRARELELIRAAGADPDPLPAPGDPAEPDRDGSESEESLPGGPADGDPV
jgi:hypothetical protein